MIPWPLTASWKRSLGWDWPASTMAKTPIGCHWESSAGSAAPVEAICPAWAA
jgi:hypothetical protein